jgi:hypothetical protein
VFTKCEKLLGKRFHNLKNLKNGHFLPLFGGPKGSFSQFVYGSALSPHQNTLFFGSSRVRALIFYCLERVKTL